MICTRLEKMIERSREYQRLREVQDKTARFQARLEKLSVVLDALHESRGALDKFSALLEVRWPAQTMAECIERVGALRAAFQDDPQVIVGEDFNKLHDALGRLQKELDLERTRAWDAYRRQLHPPIITDALISVLRSISAYPGDSGRLRRAQEELSGILRSPQVTAAMIDRCDVLLGSLEASWAAISETGTLSEEVRDFLSAAMHQGASLRLLTEGVRSWLESHKMIDDFLVTPVASE